MLRPRNSPVVKGIHTEMVKIAGVDLQGHSTGRKRHFLSGYDSTTPLPAHRHRYRLAQVPTLGLRSLKTTVTCVTTLHGMARDHQISIEAYWINFWDFCPQMLHDSKFVVSYYL